jgi:hypothetical protein
MASWVSLRGSVPGYGADCALENNRCQHSMNKRANRTSEISTCNYFDKVEAGASGEVY